MSLKKYLACDEDHYNDLEYVCLKQKRVFCINCWFKKEHYRYCQSTRCGQYTKIAHLVLNRSLEYKNSKLLQSLCGSLESYEQLRLRFLQLNFQICEMVKDFVQQKMPLLLWSMTNELLKTKASPEDLHNYYKFDSVSTEMIRIIKSTDKSMRHEYLQRAIGAYYDINHQIEGDMNVLRSSKLSRKNHKEDQVNESIQKIKNNLNDMMNNVKINIRKVIDDELEAMTSKIDPTTKYKGIVFQKTAENDGFRKRQEYPYINLLAQEYSKLSDEQNELYNGFHFSLAELESNAEQLLQVSKCFLKDKLFNIYQGISTVKSAFPYRFAYPISTTLSQDEQYEELILDLQKESLQTFDNSNPFLCTLSLIILGRQLIIIKLYNHPRFCYSMTVYNYQAKRARYYQRLIQKMGLKNVPIKPYASVDNIQFTEELTDTELVYSHFRTAYETIFLCHNGQLVFEGERVMANRGAEQFAEVMEKWRSTAQIDLNFNNPNAQMIRFFV